MRRLLLPLAALAAGCAAAGDPAEPAPARPVSASEVLEEDWSVPATPIAYAPILGEPDRVALRKFARPFDMPGTIPFVTPSGLVILLEGEVVTARDLRTGECRWTFAPNHPDRLGGQFQAAAQAGQVLLYFAGTGSGEGVLLDETTGRPIGEPFDLPSGRILLAGHGRYYLHDVYRIDAWDPAARRLVWHWSVGPPVLPVQPWDQGLRILLVDVSTPFVIAEYFNGHRGYPLTVFLSPATEEAAWDTIARFLGADGGTAAVMRETEEEIDLRDLAGGAWHSTHPARGYDGRGAWWDGGDLLFTACTRLFGAETVRVGPEGVVRSAGEGRTEAALVRYDTRTRTVRWTAPIAGETLRLQRAGRVLLEATGSRDWAPRLLAPLQRAPRADVLRGISVADGAELWRIETEAGATSWAAWGRSVILVTSDGRAVCFRRR